MISLKITLTVEKSDPLLTSSDRSGPAAFLVHSYFFGPNSALNVL